MKLVFHIFLLSSIFCFASTTTCPLGTVPSMSDNKTCFLFVSKKQPFLIAEEYCNQQGGHLASIHDVFDNTLIRENAQQNFTDSTSADFWIGFNDLQISGIWGWIDGTTFNYSDWDKQQNNSPGFDCGSVKLQGGMWISDNCDNDKSFVCAIKTPPPPPPKKCPLSWSYFNKTGYCYFVGTNKNWEDAENFCLTQNSHLASIHSSIENSFVTNLIPFGPNNQGCNSQQLAYIGLYSVTNQSSWRWVDSTPYNYSTWAPGRPGYPNNLGYCAILWNGSNCNAPIETWADETCRRVDGFHICKKLP